MVLHRSEGHRPQVTFTSDFHELVQGDLLPGPCVVRYDPWRIVPEDEVRSLAGSGRPVTAHAVFHPRGQRWQGDLWLRPGVAIDVAPDPTAQGPMMRAEMPLPEDCDELEMWFSYVDAAGRTRWDSDGGANFRLRFPAHDLDVKRAEVVRRRKAPLDGLRLEVASVDAVQAVVVRWRATKPVDAPRWQEPLEVATVGGKKAWRTTEAGIGVPTGVTVVFDLLYDVGGRRFTDDNEGTWYIPEEGRA